MLCSENTVDMTFVVTFVVTGNVTKVDQNNIKICDTELQPSIIRAVPSTAVIVEWILRYCSQIITR